MADNTIVPRVGVKCVHQITFNLAQATALDERGQAELEANYNDRFASPQEMGKLSLVFNTKVTQPMILRDEITVETTTSEINDEIIQEMKDITENTIGVAVTGWTSDAIMQRKSFNVSDFQEGTR